jgi:TRAP-type C4-dicarboxylate transport system permease small subunit
VFSSKQKYCYFTGIVHRTAGIGTAIGGFFLLGLTLLIVTNIVVRFFGPPIMGLYEIVQLILVLPISFALVYATVHKTHVFISVLVSRFTQRSQSIIQAFTYVLSLGLWVLITWASIWIIPQRIQSGEASLTIGIPYLPFRLVWVFALILFCLVLLIDLLKTLGQAVRK